MKNCIIFAIDVWLMFCVYVKTSKNSYFLIYGITRPIKLKLDM